MTDSHSSQLGNHAGTSGTPNVNSDTSHSDNNDSRHNFSGVASQKPQKHISIPVIASVFSAVAIAIVLLSARLFLPSNPKSQSEDYLKQFSSAPDSEQLCHKFIDHLPDKLGNYQRKGSAYIPPEATSHKVQIRCGIAKPSQLQPVSHLDVVDDVTWLTVSSDADTTSRKTAGLIWVTVDRPMYIAVWIPADAPTSPIQELSRFIARQAPLTPHNP